MANLPSEIITDILSRLPVKSLLQFRSVSKCWCAEIDGPDFIKLHLTRSISTGSNLSLIAESTGIIYSLDSNSLEQQQINNIIEIETPFSDTHSFLHYTCCNGLFLLRFTTCVDYDDESDSLGYILFNPSTRKHFVLPEPPPLLANENVDDDENYTQHKASLGYDAVNDDYKVFDTVLMHTDDLGYAIVVETRVYCLKSNSWHVDSDGMIKGKGSLGAYLNGVLHKVTSSEDLPCISAFDVGNGSIESIPMPEIWDIKDVAYFKEHVFDGYLTLICMYSERTDVWVMKNYGVNESWTMLMSVEAKSFDDDIRDLMPLVYSKSRAEVLWRDENEKLVWYDLGKNIVRDFLVPDLPVDFLPMVCIGSLVSVANFETEVENTRNESGSSEESGSSDESGSSYESGSSEK